MLKKFKKSDRERKLLKDSGNLMMCRKCFSAYERYYKLEADMEKTLLRTFDDGGVGDEKEDEGEVEAGVTGACEGAGDSHHLMFFRQQVKKDHVLLQVLVLQLLLVIEE